MKLIIDIDEKAYKDGQLCNFFRCYSKKLDEIIYNGIPLEEKIGHWIENASECQNIDPPYICSECGNFHLRKTNYCEQCGAKME